MQIIAHRGSKLLWPENTMLAFDKAHAAGATGFETDLRLSRDHEIILSHDDNLARFGLPEITTSKLTAAELQHVEIPSIDGTYREPMISLRELLQKYPDKRYIFDCKTSDRLLFERLQALLQELDFHRHIWFLTWSKQADALVREFFPGYLYFPRESVTIKWGLACLLGLGSILEPANAILALPAYFHGLPLIQRRRIQSLKRRGKQFVGYIVNTEKEFKRCMRSGVEIFLTDRPGLIAGLINASSRPT